MGHCSLLPLTLTLTQDQETRLRQSALRSAVSGEFLGLSEPRVNEISALWFTSFTGQCVTCRAPVTRRLLLAPRAAGSQQEPSCRCFLTLLREGSSRLLLLVHSLLEEGSGLKTQQGSPQTRLAVPVAGACGLHTRAEDGEVPGATQPERQSRGAGCARQGPETAWGQHSFQQTRN